MRNKYQLSGTVMVDPKRRGIRESIADINKRFGECLFPEIIVTSPEGDIPKKVPVHIDFFVRARYDDLTSYDPTKVVTAIEKFARQFSTDPTLLFSAYSFRDGESNRWSPMIIPVGPDERSELSLEIAWWQGEKRVAEEVLHRRGRELEALLEQTPEDDSPSPR